MATEPGPDPAGLRHARLDRLVDEMGRHDLDLLVLGRVANIRYASGVPILWNAGTRPFGPGCVVVREGREVYLMSTWDEGVPDDIPHDHLYGITWNPMNMVEVLAGIARQVHPQRVGTDAISPLFAQLLPMAFGDAAIVDGTPALRAARRTKTPEEVDAIRRAVAVADEALAAARAALAPGRTEQELTAVFMEAMARRGVTTPAIQDVVRVTSVGAARAPRGQAVVEVGDLVTFDAGVVADGYAGEVGRTLLVADDADVDATGELHERADRLRRALLDACRSGGAASDLLAAYDTLGEPLPVGPVAHGLGLGFDDPVITRELPRTATHEQLEPGMVLVLTACVFDEERGSVIIREPVAITADGPDLLSTSPHWPARRLADQGAPT